MRRCLPACLVALLLVAAPAAAQQPGPAPRPDLNARPDFAAHPDFAAYRAEPALRGAAKMPDFRGRDAAFADFRTRLNEAARQKANFSGHYVITQIGCGSGCNTAYVIDKATGAVALFPRGGAEHPELRLHYSARSSLVVASWRSRTDDKCWTERFVRRDGAWEKLDATYKSGQACFA